MKFTSRTFLSKFFFALFLTLWCITLILLTVNHTFSVVDKKGCRRNVINYMKLKRQYKNLILKECNQNN